MTLSAVRVPEPFVPSDRDEDLARESSRRLERVLRMRGVEPVRVQLLDGGDAAPVVTLPASALQLLLQILVEMAKGNALTLTPHNAELTTQRAADLLNVSRPYLVGLLENGVIPFRKVGTHRRVLFRDVLAYRRRIDAAREKTLRKLTALSQELRLDEIDTVV